MKGARVKALSTAAVLTLGVLSAPSMAAVDMFLKIGDIEGESQDSTHKGEIDVLAWSWGLSQSGTRGRANGACIQDLSVTKWIDKASVDLIMGATIGETYEERTGYVFYGRASARGRALAVSLSGDSIGPMRERGSNPIMIEPRRSGVGDRNRFSPGDGISRIVSIKYRLFELGPAIVDLPRVA